MLIILTYHVYHSKFFPACQKNWIISLILYLASYSELSFAFKEKPFIHYQEMNYFLYTFDSLHIPSPNFDFKQQFVTMSILQIHTMQIFFPAKLRITAEMLHKRRHKTKMGLAKNCFHPIERDEKTEHYLQTPKGG